MIRTALLLLLVMLLAACTASGPAEPGAFFSCGVPNCGLARTAGVRMVTEGSSRHLLHEATGARVDVEYVDGRARPQRVAALFEEWNERLSPVVNWDQAPQSLAGFVVRGLSGNERPPPGVFVVADPTRVWMAAYENPATGSVLVLRARVAASRWNEAWSDLEPIVTRVTLTPAF